MKTRWLFRSVALTFVTLSLLAGCASGPKFQSDYDPSVDFSNYRTYGFYSPLNIEGPNYSTLFGASFRDAISREMDARGYVQSKQPDLLINVAAQMQEKVQVREYNTMPPPYYGYRGGYYSAWAGYGWNTQTHVSQYTEGTVNIDLVDTGLKRLVWEGVAIGRMDQDLTNAELRQRIDEGVTKMFEGYPFRAGGS